MKTEYDGVKYYGSNDLSIGFFLEKSAKILDNFSSAEHVSSINYILELHNIKLLLDSGSKLLSWTEQQYSQYQNICKKIPTIVGRYFSAICDENIASILGQVCRKYIVYFWAVFSNNKIYKHISKDIFAKVISEDEFFLKAVLYQKNIVDYYGKEISNKFISNEKTAEILIEVYLVKDKYSHNEIYIPKELSIVQKEKILLDYIESEKVSTNYLKLIYESQSMEDFKLSDSTRLKAKKKYQAFIEQYFANNSSFEFEVSVKFSDDQEDILLEQYDEHGVALSYSRRWLKENTDYPTLLNNFIYLFGYTDSTMRSMFVSLQSEMSAIEAITGVQGEKAYSFGIKFRLKSLIYATKMLGYNEELNQLNIQLEAIFKWFFETYLPMEFNAEGFIYNAPSKDITVLEKCRQIVTEMDGVLKQYRLYCTEGMIDRELFEMSSEHIIFKNLPSLQKQKYIYAKSEKIKLIILLLFSDQSTISFNVQTEVSYNSFFERIRSETVCLNNLVDFQKRDIQPLIEFNIVDCDDNGVLNLDEDKAYILYELYSFDVVCLLYYKKYAHILEEWIKSEDLECEASLFARNEQDYLNYMLNKAQFSNGYDLRNKYSHATHSVKEEDNKANYIELLKIMVLIIIKINEEFCLKELQEKS